MVTPMVILSCIQYAPTTIIITYPTPTIWCLLVLLVDVVCDGLLFHMFGLFILINNLVIDQFVKFLSVIYINLLEQQVKTKMMDICSFNTS